MTRTVGNQDWRPERPVAHPLGYGTKLDLYSSHWLIDIKTKDGNQERLETMKSEVEHWMQLAACDQALCSMETSFESRRSGILFVSRDNVACHLVEVHARHLELGWVMFQLLLEYWKHANNYFPK